jgi:hypothetical protein
MKQNSVDTLQGYIIQIDLIRWISYENIFSSYSIIETSQFSTNVISKT